MALTLFYSNDVHSLFDRWLRMVTLLHRERAAARDRGDGVLYVDAGDHMDRFAPEVEGTGGVVNVALLGAAGCQAATWGNGEVVSTRPAALSRLAAAAAYPVLLSNLRTLADGEPLPGAATDAVLEAGGVRVGLFGLVVPFNVLYEPLGLTCPPFLEVAAGAVARLRERCDLVVCLSHLGLRRDRELAAAVPGIGVIVGAHSHHALAEPERVGGTLIVQAGHRGAFLGRLRLARAPGAAGGWEVLDAALLPVTPDLPPDPAAAAVLSRYRAEAAGTLAEVIAVLPEAIPHALEGPAPLAEAVARELHRRLGPDVTLVNTGLFLAGFPAGPVTRAALLERCPSLVNAVVAELTGRQIRQALAQATDPECIYYKVWAGFRGKYVGTLVAAGDVAALRDDRVYRVATLGPLYLGYTGYDTLSQGRNARWEMGFTLRELVAELLAAGVGTTLCKREG